MAASADPPGAGDSDGGQQDGRTTNGNGANGVGVPDNSVPLRHNPGISTVWTPEEQSILDELLEKYATHNNIAAYAKIAMQLKDKTVRDVALRIRWMSKKENGKRRKDDSNPSRKSKDRKDKVSESLPKSSQVANRSNGPPPYAQSMNSSMETDDGISIKDIGGLAGQLLEQNAYALDQISANFSALKIRENISLLCQTRNNILTILNDTLKEEDMPDLMKRMPALPVKLNEELASSILPRANLSTN